VHCAVRTVGAPGSCNRGGWGPESCSDLLSNGGTVRVPVSCEASQYGRSVILGLYHDCVGTVQQAA
jgi:hypothetical protein